MRFIDCHWPKLDRPTRIFADGSSGIEVMCRTPRNVWFPDDTVFLNYYPDALYPAEQAVLKAMPFRRGLVNLTPPEADIWMLAYDEAVASFPKTHTVLQTPRHVNFLRHREVESERIVTLAADSVSDDGASVLRAGSVVTKRAYAEFVSDLLTPEECVALVDGKLDEAELRASKAFFHVHEQRVFSGEKERLTLDQWKAR